MITFDIGKLMLILENISNISKNCLSLSNSLRGSGMELVVHKARSPYAKKKRSSALSPYFS